MKNFKLTLMVSLFLGVSQAADYTTPPVHVDKREQAHTRVSNPSAINLEMLGRGMLWNLTFDQVLNDDMAAGFGVGSVSTQTAAGADGPESAKIVPAYFNYYFSRTQGSVYFTAGVNLVTNASKVRGFESSTGGLRFPRDSIIPTAGIGYENRGDNGFLFRAAGYALFGDNVAPWMGFTFGYCF